MTKSLLGIKTPEEKLNMLAKEMKENFRIIEEKDLPEWLRKGTDQYQKTLDYIKKTGTSNIYYNKEKDKYFIRIQTLYPVVRNEK